MSGDSSSVERLLREVERGAVTPHRYSHRSVYGRLEPLLATFVLAVVAMSASVLLAELRPMPTMSLPARRSVGRT